MMARRVLGYFGWGLERDDEGYATFKITHLVETDDTADGPARIAATAGLPVIGSVWHFGNDLDEWAFCHPTLSVKPYQVTEEKNTIWAVDNTFSLRPMKRCQDEQVKDPLCEPAKVSGSFVEYQKEITKDRNGDPIVYSSLEKIKGAQASFDFSKAQVNIEVNSASLALPTIAAMIHCVNSAPLWGMAVRCVKFSRFSWEWKYNGMCNRYYVRKFGFDVDPEGFDRDIGDEGTKVLRGQWVKKKGIYAIGTPPRDPFGEYRVATDLGTAAWPDGEPTAAAQLKPSNFVRYKDWNGECSHVLLDGHGMPAMKVVCVGTACQELEGDTGTIHIEHYGEADLLLLGIPTTL